MAKKSKIKLACLRVRSIWKKIGAADLYIEINGFRIKDSLRINFRKTLPEKLFSAAKRRFAPTNFRFWLPLGVLFVLVLIYPLIPLLQYHLDYVQAKDPSPEKNDLAIIQFEQELKEMIDIEEGRLPLAQERELVTDFTNKIMIPKIGVDTEIVEGTDAEISLNQGVWRIPISSTPFSGGNTVLTAHRYKFTPPSNKTFYLLDKLEPGDEIKILWQGKLFIHNVSETKVVSPDNVEVLKNTKNPIITLITCTPLFTSSKRLVVTAHLVNIQ